MKRLLGSAVLLVFLSAPALAQTHSVPDRKCIRERRCVEFGGAEVEGERLPIGDTFGMGKRPTKFENLIKQRMSFEPELQGSVDHL